MQDKQWHAKIIVLIFIFVLSVNTSVAVCADNPTILKADSFRHYIDSFNENDEELYVDLTALITEYESRKKPNTKPMAPGLYAEYGFLLMRRGENAVLAGDETLAVLGQFPQLKKLADALNLYVRNFDWLGGDRYLLQLVTL